ncbi:uncharacterized protein LOC127718081 [Mytilus californianus]|uniref:uncharacterized protein LOC127718081 n=1 Tax=Mytilus californianus TaxID=6549 RepID=UPI0022450FFA|nr:uncharacterized protein LOC127718081 [Mytilus californianus]
MLISRICLILVLGICLEGAKESYFRGHGRHAEVGDCPPNMRDDGTSCWLDSYGRGVGRSPDKTPCPSGMRDDGTSCWSDAHIYGKGCCCTIFGCCNKCESGYHDDGCTCRKTDVGIKVTLFQRQGCGSDEELNGLLCYPKCKEGYHASGCCICTPNGGPGIRKTFIQRLKCHADEDRYLSQECYPKCKAGYSPNASRCYKNK